jgi:hypothetical protein
MLMYVQYMIVMYSYRVGVRAYFILRCRRMHVCSHCSMSGMYVQTKGYSHNLYITEEILTDTSACQKCECVAEAYAERVVHVLRQMKFVCWQAQSLSNVVAKL